MKNSASSGSTSIHGKEKISSRDFFWIYRAIVQIARILARFFLDKKRIQAIDQIRVHSRTRPKPSLTTRVWFHGASVGELESLWALVERFAEDAHYEVILTVFSQSAYEHALKCMKRLRLGQVTYAGYSPFEGDWEEGLKLLAPDLFITAKYEAWPELWHALGVLGIPLCIVGAKARSSLLWAKRILWITRSRLPKLMLVSFSSASETKLRNVFKVAEIFTASDPRWDRVRARAEQKHERVSALEESLNHFPRPWIIAGSSWETDWIAWRGKFDSSRFEGTLIAVPHKIDPASIKAQEILLRDLGWTPIRSSDRSGIRPAGKIAIVVDEMGFLAELYRLADLAYVGGGFGSSIHSTIEPAVHGIPIYAGPEGAEKFDEIAMLRDRGMLHLLETHEDWAEFRVASQKKLTPHEQKAWKAGVAAFFGSAQSLTDRLKRENSQS